MSISTPESDSLRDKADLLVAPAPSPFLPGTFVQFALDGTSLNTAKTCLRKYKLSQVDGWRKKDESVHLKFGSLFAGALELYHKDHVLKDNDHEEALLTTVSWLLVETFGWNSDHPKKNRDTLLRSTIWYLDAYKDDPAKVLILEDGTPAVELTFKLELPWEAAPGLPYLWCGHLDKVVTFAEGVHVMDQKTSGGGIGAYFFKQFSPNTQMSGYSFAGKAILGSPIAGVIIDAIQIAAGYTAFARGFTNRTQGQLDEWIADTKKWTEIIRFSAERDYWPMNEASCHQYDGCVFRDICCQDPSVRQNYLETYFERNAWNPLKSR